MIEIITPMDKETNFTKNIVNNPKIVKDKPTIAILIS